MKYENYYNICENAKNIIRKYNVICERFNALFYYEYIMYLIGPNI